MPFEDLHDYIQALAKRNDLRIIRDEVSPDLELTQILSEEERIGGAHTLVFEKVTGSSVPAIGNLFSTHDKMLAILGDEPGNIGERLRNLTRMPDQSESMISRGFEMWRELGGVRPKIAGSMPGGYTELEKVDLSRYPITKTWPQDAGRFITLPMVITKDPVTGARNAGMYRMQVYDSETTGMHWHIHKGGSSHFLSQGKKEMDVAVVIGSDPLTMFSAVAPLPEFLDEFSFVGLVGKKRLELAKGVT
ncbi:3-octaprenyl-4-hydroxybenzoate carboxy-lyase, partial [mine drainage metagenome]